MHRRLGVLVVLVGVSITGSAFADRHAQWTTRTSHDSGASGVTSGASVTEIIPLRTGYENADKLFDGYPGLALGGITVGERADKPCSVSIYFNKLDESAKEAKPTPVTCATGSAGDFKSAKLPDDAFIRGVQVCTNDDANNPRLKGVRFWGIKFDDLGKPANIVSPVEFERTNCKKWHDAKYCSTGEVASAMKVYTKDDSATAIGLVCRAAYTPASAPKDFTLTTADVKISDGTSSSNTRFDVNVRLKNNLSKPLRYFTLQFRPDASKYGTTCGMSEQNTVDIPANGTSEVPMHVFCDWEVFYKQIPGCTPGATCNVEFIYYIHWLGESYADYFRPSGGSITVPIKRPAAPIVPVKAPTLPGIPGKPLPK